MNILSVQTCVKYLCTAAKNQNNFTTYVLFTYIPKFIYSIYLSQVFKSRVNELHAAIEKNRQRKPTSPIPMSNHNFPSHITNFSNILLTILKLFLKMPIG